MFQNKYFDISIQLDSFNALKTKSGKILYLIKFELHCALNYSVKFIYIKITMISKPLHDKAERLNFVNVTRFVHVA